MRAQDFADLAESRNVFVIPTARGVADIEVCVASADERATQHRNDGELEPELHPERLEEQRSGARHRGRQAVDGRKWGRNHFLWEAAATLSRMREAVKNQYHFCCRVSA